MNVRIMSEMECIQHTYSKDVKPCIIISINSYGDKENEQYKPPYLYNNPNVMGVLRLFFDDIEPRHLDKEGRLRVMGKGDVGKIYEFIKDWMGLDIEEIIIHCHAGISRSSAVACGICLWLGQDDMWIWESGKYCPNRWVLSLMTNGHLTKEDIEHRYEVNDISHNIECEWLDKMIVKPSK